MAVKNRHQKNLKSENGSAAVTSPDKPTENGESERRHRSKKHDKSIVYIGNTSVDLYKVLPLSVACVMSLIAILAFWSQDMEGDHFGYVPSESNGGWHAGDEETLTLYDSGICNIDRKYAEDITEEEFEKVYRYKKPLIVKFKNGAYGWTDPEKWSVENLKKEYGEWYIQSGTALEIVRRGGNGEVFTPFSDFVDKLIHSRDTSGEPMYVFDRMFYNDSSLPSTLKPPKYLRIQNHLDDSIFFLGSSGSGVAFHKHADAWNGVIYGRKRWFLYPKNKTPPGGIFPAYSHKDWFLRLYPQLSPEDKPMECIQEAGEILYLPESTYHGTINIGDTIAIGIQKKQAVTEMERIMYEEKDLQVKLAKAQPEDIKELKKKLIETWENLLQLYPDSAEVQNRAGSLFFDYNNLKRALACTKKAYELDKHFLFAVLQMAKIHSKLGELKEAEALYQQAVEMNPNLWDVYAQYGDFLLQNNRPQDAIPILQKGIVLKRESLPFWNRLLRAQQAVGDREGAVASRKVINELHIQQQKRQH